MDNTYAILELAAISDSISFKQMMGSRYKGNDITPRSTIPGTWRGGVVYFGDVTYRSDSSNAKALQSWLRQFANLSPVILYISSHHINLSPTPVNPKPSQGTKFYNNNSVAFEFIQGGIQLYNMAEDDKYSDVRTTVRGCRLGENLVLLIIDGCNMHGLISDSSAIEMQKLLSSKTGKPVVLGYNGKSGATSQIYKIFLNEIPLGTDFSKAFARNTENQNKLIKYWVEAGKKWKSEQRKIMSALDNNGNIYDNHGNLMKKTK